MARAARLISTFAMAAASASSLGWLIRQSPLFHALAVWLLIACCLIFILALALDDGLIAHLRCDANAYYAGLGGSAAAILLGVMLVWLA